MKTKEVESTIGVVARLKSWTAARLWSAGSCLSRIERLWRVLGVCGRGRFGEGRPMLALEQAESFRGDVNKGNWTRGRMHVEGVECEVGNRQAAEKSTVCQVDF